MRLIIFNCCNKEKNHAFPSIITCELLQLYIPFSFEISILLSIKSFYVLKFTIIQYECTENMNVSQLRFTIFVLHK